MRGNHLAVDDRVLMMTTLSSVNLLARGGIGDFGGYLLSGGHGDTHITTLIYGTVMSFYGVISDLGHHVLQSYHRNKQLPTQASHYNSQLHVAASATLSSKLPVLPQDYHVMRNCSACLSDELSLSASAILTPVCLSRHPSDSLRVRIEIGQHVLRRKGS